MCRVSWRPCLGKQATIPDISDLSIFIWMLQWHSSSPCHYHNIPQERKKQRYCPLLHFKSFIEKNLILSKLNSNMKITQSKYSPPTSLQISQNQNLSGKVTPDLYVFHLQVHHSFYSASCLLKYVFDTSWIRPQSVF